MLLRQVQKAANFMYRIELRDIPSETVVFFKTTFGVFFSPI